MYYSPVPYSSIISYVCLILVNKILLFGSYFAKTIPLITSKSIAFNLILYVLRSYNVR